MQLNTAEPKTPQTPLAFPRTTAPRTATAASNSGFTNPTGPVKPPPVVVYRTGLTGNRLNSNSKSHVQPVPTGIPADCMTGLPVGMTGLGIFYFFKFKFEF